MILWVPLTPIGFVEACATRILTGKWRRAGTLRVWRQGAIIGGMDCDLIDLASLDEPKTAALLDKISNQKRGRLLELGAHVGVYAIPFAKRGWEVIALEPSPETFKILKANVARNQVSGTMQIRNVAAWSSNGVATFLISRSHSGEDSLLALPDSAGVQVQTVSLDELLRTTANLDLAKVDIEGAELEALSSTPPALIKRVAIWVMELRAAHLKAVCQLMEAQGYKWRIIEELVRGKGVFNVLFHNNETPL